MMEFFFIFKLFIKKNHKTKELKGEKMKKILIDAEKKTKKLGLQLLKERIN